MIEVGSYWRSKAKDGLMQVRVISTELPYVTIIILYRSYDRRYKMLYDIFIKDFIPLTSLEMELL